MTQEKTELDLIEERLDEAIEVEAKSRCFKSQTGRIFWDGFGGEENHKKWVDNVKCDSGFIKSFYRKEIEELIKSHIKKVEKMQMPGEQHCGCLGILKYHLREAGISLD